MFEMTTKLMVKYESVFLSGNQENIIKAIHTIDNELDLVEDKLKLMLDFVANIAPKIEPLPLSKFLLPLMENETKETFFRKAVLAKYFFAYLSCFHPEQAKPLDTICQEKLKRPQDDAKRTKEKFIQFKTLIMGAAEVALLMHIIPEKFQLDMQKKWLEKSAQLSSPGGEKLLQKFKKRLMSLYAPDFSAIKDNSSEASADNQKEGSPIKEARTSSLLKFFRLSSRVGSRPSTSRASSTSISFGPTPIISPMIFSLKLVQAEHEEEIDPRSTYV